MRFVLDPLDPSTHAGLRWSHPFTLSPLRAMDHVPVYAVELRRLSGSLPIVIRQRGHAAEAVALIGDHWLEQPAFTDAGHWRAGSVPQALLVHPFSVVLDAETADRAVAVARDRNCVHPLASHAFFSDAAEPSAAVQRVIRRLEILDGGAVPLRAAVDMLLGLDVLVEIRSPADADIRQPAVLWTLDDTRLLALDPARAPSADATVFWRLAGAMSASRHLLAQALRTHIAPETGGEPWANLLVTPVEPAALPAEAEPEPAPEHPFLIDDAQVLRFRVNASRSVFRKG